MRNVKEFRISQDCAPNVTVEVNEVDQEEENKRLLTMIRRIIDRGNDAEVKKKGDGKLTIYEVKKNKVTV